MHHLLKRRLGIFRRLNLLSGIRQQCQRDHRPKIGFQRLLLESLETRTMRSGVWTLLPGPSRSGFGTMLLLSDGSVMLHEVGISSSPAWYKLTPDASGGYVNGTWTSLKPMSVSRLYFTSDILPSGKVFVLGGEFGQQYENNSGEIYEPITDRWTTIAPFPQPTFGDTPSEVSPNGNVLAGSAGASNSNQTYIYDPVSDSWSPSGPGLLYGDTSAEETWVKLPDQSILTYTVNPQDGLPPAAQRFVPGPNRRLGHVGAGRDRPCISLNWPGNRSGFPIARWPGVLSWCHWPHCLLCPVEYPGWDRKLDHRARSSQRPNCRRRARGHVAQWRRTHGTLTPNHRASRKPVFLSAPDQNLRIQPNHEYLYRCDSYQQLQLEPSS
jgi:hypothetical protein